MKLKVEVSPNESEEIVIRCKSRTEKVKRIENTIEYLINEDAEKILFIGETEFYVPYKKILFFEPSQGKIFAHTKDKIFTTSEKTLGALEQSLPPYFLRASKSCIINALQISSISHNLTGPSKITFASSDKVAYASRSYYKYLKERVYSLRGL